MTVYYITIRSLAYMAACFNPHLGHIQAIILCKILAWRWPKYESQHVAIHSKAALVILINRCVDGNYMLICNMMQIFFHSANNNYL